jgi:5'-3' exonuclease
MSAERVVPEAIPAGEEFLLIDLSSIAHPLWHTSQGEPDPNATSIRTVERVRALASGHPRAAICADSGKSFRAEVDPTYKANRPVSDAALHHQITLAIETLRGDGFPVWAVKGYEADDLIATAVAKALEIPGARVMVASSDKDLLALVGERVSAKSLRDGTVIDEAGVVERFGVRPCQMRDYLTLVGDSSDNIKGARGIGPKKAAELLKTFVELDQVYLCIGDGNAKLQPATQASLEELKPRLATVRALVTMRTDAPIPFAEILATRVPKDSGAFAMDTEEEMEEQVAEEAAAFVAETTSTPAAAPTPAGPKEAPKPSTAIAVQGEVLPAPAEWERQLDPRSLRQATQLAQDMFASRMFGAYGTPQGVLSTVMVGRELGLPALAALRSIHVVEGRHTLSAALMVALVLKAGLAEYFEPVEFDEKKATFLTKRRGARKEVSLTHTIEMAVTAGLVKKDSNWLKVPIDMLCARAQSRLARMIYPDLLAGLYTPEELEEMRGGA